MLPRSVKFRLNFAGEQQAAKFASPLGVLHAGERRISQPLDFGWSELRRASRDGSRAPSARLTGNA
jgi:hypothetical protein